MQAAACVIFKQVFQNVGGVKAAHTGFFLDQLKKKFWNLLQEVAEGCEDYKTRRQGEGTRWEVARG